MDETYELHTCCDLSIDGDGSECLTFTRGEASLLDVSTSFEEIRFVDDIERRCLFDALVKAFKDHDLGWDKHFTDSTYFDILDWLAWEFNVDLDDEANTDTPLGEAMSEIQNYIWDALCKETGNYQEKTAEHEMVNKQEFIEKVRNWLEKHTYDDKYWTPDGNDFFVSTLIDDICKHLEE